MAENKLLYEHITSTIILNVITIDGEVALSDSFSGDDGGPLASTGLNGGIVRTLLLLR